MKKLLTITAALAVTTALAIFAFVQREQAIKQRDQARSRELAALATAQLESDPQQSLRLALQAAETARTAQATRSAVTAPPTKRPR